MAGKKKANGPTLAGLEKLAATEARSALERSSHNSVPYVVLSTLSRRFCPNLCLFGALCMVQGSRRHWEQMGAGKWGGEDDNVLHVNPAMPLSLPLQLWSSVLLAASLALGHFYPSVAH